MLNNKWLYRTLSLFFVLLLSVPCLGVLRERRNRELIGEMENRSINPKPTASIFSSEYFRQLEVWFNDRILGRKELIRGWSMLNGKLFNVLVSKEVVQGKEGFLFMPSNVVDKVIDIEQKITTLKKIDAVCKSHNARFIVFMAPHGEWALGELLPDKYKPVNLLTLDKCLNIELDKAGVEHISVSEALGRLSLAERKSMYYPGDYHWNSKGAFWAAREILNKLGYANRINSPVTYVKEKSKADIYTRKVGWPAIISTVDKPWNDSFSDSFKQSYTLAGVTKLAKTYEKMRYTHSGEEIYQNSSARYKITILVLGDSFAGKLNKYLLQDIETLVVTHNIDVSSPKKNIDIKYLLDKYKPQIVLYEKMGANFYGHHYSDVFGTTKI